MRIGGSSVAQCWRRRERRRASATSASWRGRPTASRLAFVAAVDPPRWIVGDRPPIGSAASRSSKLPTPTARRITRTDWRWDEVGHRDHWSHLFVIDVDAGAPPRQVTRGDWGVGAITWHPNGRTRGVRRRSQRAPRPACRARRSGRSTSTPGRVRTRSKPRCVLDAGGGAAHPAYSPDGRWLAAVGILAAATARRRDARPAARTGRRVAPARGAGARARPPDRELDRHRPHRLDGLRALRARCGATSARSSPSSPTADASLPERWQIDPRTRRAARRSARQRASEPTGRGPTSVTHVDRRLRARGIVSRSATPGGRGLEVMTRRPRRSSTAQFAHPHLVRHGVAASLHTTGDAPRRGARRRRTDRDVDRLATGCRRCRAADDRRRARRAARRMGAGAPRRDDRARQRRVPRGVPQHPGQRRLRTATGSARSSATGAVSTPTTCTPPSTT